MSRAHTARMLCAAARFVVVLLTCVRASASQDNWTFIAMAIVIGLTLARGVIKRGTVA